MYALMKKRRYWPKYIPGEKIIADFAGKAVVLADTNDRKASWASFFESTP